MRKIVPICLAISLVASLTISSAATTSTPAAQEGQTSRAQLSKVYSGQAYSPYAGRTFPERPLWGDSHLHTSLSMDAGGFSSS